jgi:hypothetical protein
MHSKRAAGRAVLRICQKQQSTNVQENQMSTDWRPIPDIPFAELFDGRLEKYGIRALIVDRETEGWQYLEGPDGTLSVSRAEDGTCIFTRRGVVPWTIFDAIAEEFKIEWVSEYDHRYWGFATEKEWDDWNNQLAKESEDEFYNDLVKYLRDEPNGLRPGTIGMIKAEIAKTLVKGDLGLMAPEKRNALLEAVEAIYDRDHAVKIELTEQDLAAAELMAARTDDLPKA